jgi:hypothetical protein
MRELLRRRGGLACVGAFASTLLVASPARSDQPICDYRVILEPGGGWHFEWIPCPPRQDAGTSDTTSSSGGSTSGRSDPIRRRRSLMTEAERMFASNKKAARRYLRNHRSHLKNALRREEGLTLTDEDFWKVDDDLSRARALSGPEWDEFVRQHPECANEQGCTGGNEGIAIKDTDNQAAFLTVQRVLEHEALHDLIEQAAQRDGRETTETQDHSFIDKFFQKFP